MNDAAAHGLRVPQPYRKVGNFSLRNLWFVFICLLAVQVVFGAMCRARWRFAVKVASVRANSLHL